MTDDTISVTETFLADELENGNLSSDDYTAVLFYVHNEQNQRESGTSHGPVTKFLHTMITGNRQSVLRQYMQRIVSDVKENQSGPLRGVLEAIYTGMLNSESNELEETFEGAHLKLSAGNVETSLVMAFSRLSGPATESVLVTIAKYAPSAVAKHTRAMAKISKGGGKVAAAALVVLYLSLEAYQSIKKWWNNEITGKRCAKNIVDALGSAGGLVAGGYAGGATGLGLFGPLGLVVGSVIGGVVGENVSNMIMDHLTRTLFDLPKDVALENAYKILGVHHKADNNEINCLYRELCLKLHPDKGGSLEAFQELQSAMAVIKIARENNNKLPTSDTPALIGD